MPDHEPPHDVIIVLGAAVRHGGRPSRALARRVARGIELFHAGEAAALLLCGGIGAHPPAEALVMRDIALDAGVPADRVFVETGSRTTLANAVNSAAIMTREGWRTAVIVSDAFHLPRGLLAFRVVGVRARGRAVKGAWRGPFPEPLLVLAYEACAIPWYVVQILLGRHRRRPDGGGDPGGKSAR